MVQGKEERLREIARQIADCTKCPLYKAARNPVPGEGNPEAPVVFVGEAPGRHEDLQGRPFVGRAGQLLEESLISIGLSREDVFITNVLHHRPPGNRDPTTEEVEACRPYFLEQLEVIQPKVVVALGRFALNIFLPEAKISKSRGKMKKVDGYDFILFPIYHPAAALRSGSLKADYEEDFRKLGKVLELERGRLEEMGDRVEDRSLNKKARQEKLF